MKELYQKNKKVFIYIFVAITLILTLVIGTTFAYFQTQGNTTANQTINVSTSTTDTFNLTVSKNINLGEVSQANFSSSANSNISDTSIATATLAANNTEAAATQHYYLYYFVSNPFVRTKNSTTPELLLKLEYASGSGSYTEITNANKANYAGVDLAGLTYRTVNSGARATSGWDITDEAYIRIINNRTINAAKSSTTIENFRITVTFVNLEDTDQEYNAGKSYTGELLIQKEEYKTFAQTIIDKYNGVDGTENIYYHDGVGTYGAYEAGDNSYRYSGAS